MVIPFDTHIPENIKKYKIGLRTIKTSIAVLLCLAVQFLVPSLSAINAAIAAIVCMRETPGKSFETGLNRFIGTLVGGIFGYLLMKLSAVLPYYNEWLYIFVIPVGMMLCISVCVWLKKHDAVVICCVVFLIIALETELNTSGTLVYVGMRIVDTVVGIIFATLVNKFFFPYKGENTI